MKQFDDGGGVEVEFGSDAGFLLLEKLAYEVQAFNDGSGGVHCIYVVGSEDVVRRDRVGRGPCTNLVDEIKGVTQRSLRLHGVGEGSKEGAESALECIGGGARGCDDWAEFEQR